ncbi:hypothetical protein [Paenibacillus bouchesdurhonensis]|uniref:hypothetical protein n=1 Tax=Paenibacillus bouchesdurhonensis TaxID=1870990 RepID=UPI001F4104C8|nr:hypothetical protein [Paenibacillus bouchesdurhonensis]
MEKDVIYETFLQDKKVPKFSSISSIVDMDHQGKEVVSPDEIEQSAIDGLNVENMTFAPAQSETVSTDLTIINNNGEYYIIDGDMTIPSNSKSSFTNAKLKGLFTRELKVKEVLDFKTKINNIYSNQKMLISPAATTPTTILTSITKSNWFYDDSLFYDLDTFEVARSITEYTIYKSQDADPNYDYLTVDAFTTWYPAYDNRNIINGIQGTIDNQYNGDELISYYPNTGSIDTQLQNNTQYQIGIGYPFAVTANVTWSSGAKVKMQARGDQETERYYQFFYGTDGSRYNWIGSGAPVDTRYTATYKSAGTLLGLYVTSSVRHQWFNESTSEWKNNTEVLSYDY